MKSSYRKELSDFFNKDMMLDASLVPSSAAFCLARQKISYSAFIDLHSGLINDFYNHSTWKDWHGFRLVAIDGSTAHVFDNDENVKFFKGWRGRNGKGKVCPKARLSLAYDPLNGLIVDAQMSSTADGEDKLAELHMAESSPQDLNIFDRGYLSYRLMMEHERLQLHYCARVPTHLYTRLVDDFMKSDDDDTVVEYYPSYPIGNKYRKQGGEVTSVRVRLIKILLESGEVEVLATNVFDQRLNVKSFQKLYHLRWGVEEEYKRLKSRDDLEDFSGTKVEMMKQDFHSAIIRLNLSSLISMEARLKLTHQGKKKKHHHAPNMSLALGHIRILLTLIRQDDFDEGIVLFIRNLTSELCRSSIPIRPNRTFPRKRKPIRSGYSHGYKRAI